MVNIKHCRCGSTEVYLVVEVNTEGGFNIHICCHKCGNRTPSFKNIGSVINYWNNNTTKEDN